MYDTFSNDYDRFVHWPSRLAFEMPFIEQQLNRQSGPTIDRQPAPKVLDAACGTGMHVVALAQRGYRAAGADLSAGMVEQARRNAAEAQVTARFAAAGFGHLAHTFQGDPLFPFDTVLCLGNSLPHLLTPSALAAALADFAACLRPGGSILIQNRNFDAALSQRQRWMEPQAHREPGKEWLFLRFYDFEPGGLLQFNIVTLKREEDGAWQQQVIGDRLYPLQQAELIQFLETAGFGEITCYGSMSGAPFERETSGNLIVTACVGRAVSPSG